MCKPHKQNTCLASRLSVFTTEFSHQLHRLVHFYRRAVHFRIRIDKLHQFRSRFDGAVFVSGVDNARIEAVLELT